MPTEIKLDYDGNMEPTEEDLKNRLKSIMRIYGSETAKIKTCTTQRGVHKYITIDAEIPDQELVTIQAILGSDPHREIFNLERVRDAQIKDWNVLFIAKYKGGEKVSYEVPTIEETLNLTESQEN